MNSEAVEDVHAQRFNPGYVACLIIFNNDILISTLIGNLNFKQSWNLHNDRCKTENFFGVHKQHAYTAKVLEDRTFYVQNILEDRR